MRIETRKNFLTPEECAQLNDLTDYGVANNLMTLGNQTTVRYTSRLDSDLYQYPQWVLDLSVRIRSFCGVADYPIVDVGGAQTEFKAPHMIYIAKGKSHFLRALEDDTVACCVHALRTGEREEDILDPSMIPAGITNPLAAGLAQPL